MTRTRSLILATIATATSASFICPTAASAHSAPQSSTNSTATYKVRSGDNLVGIARKTGTLLADLLVVNNITVTSTILPGQTLTLAPVTAPAKPSAATQGVQTSPYTVVSGDYLAGIATKNGVTLKALLAANGLIVSSAIHAGQVLQLPPATKPMVPPKSSKSSSTPKSTTSTPSDILVTYLRAQVGKPYRFFTAGPDTFDCSGLVVAGFKQIGVTLTHQSRMQATMGTAVDFRNEPLVAGDLVFLRSSIDPTQIGHVGVALDSKTWIQAPGSGMSVRIRSLPSDDRIEAVRRILAP